MYVLVIYSRSGTRAIEWFRTWLANAWQTIRGHSATLEFGHLVFDSLSWSRNVDKFVFQTDVISTSIVVINYLSLQGVFIFIFIIVEGWEFDKYICLLTLYYHCIIAPRNRVMHDNHVRARFYVNFGEKWSKSTNRASQTILYKVKCQYIYIYYGLNVPRK